MAVAVKNNTDTRAPAGLSGLALSSLVGGIYVLVGAAVLAVGLPRLWAETVSPALLSVKGVDLAFVDTALLLVAEAAAVVGLVYGGGKLLGTEAPAGTRTGVAAVVAWLVLGALATVGTGHLIERYLNPGEVAGRGLTLAAGVGILVWGVALLLSPGFRKWIPEVDEQGWFRVAPYKPAQGQRVRYGTLIGLLLLVAAGLYTLLTHRTLDAGPRNWTLLLPFGLDAVTTLRDVPFALPVILAVVGAWFAYRVVNFPMFADFLIATEAEVNKISWATRASLVQDTIVVLVTVVLFTVFLLVVDVTWGFLLTSVDVLRKPPAVTTQQSDKLDW